MENRHRNTALVLIGAGLFLLLGYLIGFFTVASLFVLWAGFHYIRANETKKGYILIIIGILMILSNHSSLIIAVIFIFLGYTYFRSQKIQGSEQFVQKHEILQSLKWNQQPWELKSMSAWSLIGEIQLDLSMALPEEEETTLVFQGLIADVDILIPEDFGVLVEATVVFGQVDIFNQKEVGAMNKVNWKSPGYESSKYKVKLNLSYMIGDVDIKVI